MSGCTVLALSQSGRTPDVVDYARRARLRGAYVVAVTNDPASELARESDAVLELRARAEQAVAATKTYSNQVAALGLLAAHGAGPGQEFADDLQSVAGRMPALTASLKGRIGSVATPFACAGRMFVVGRWRRVRHRPGDRTEAARDVPYCRRAADGDRPPTRSCCGARLALPRLGDRVRRRQPSCRHVEAVERAHEAGATIVASGTAAESVPHAQYVLPSPATSSPLLSPLLSILPGQLFAWALARARGLDPDAPRGLSKVTLAR